MMGKSYFRIFFVLLVIGLLFSGCGQSEPDVYTVGIVNRVPVLEPVVDGFKDRMAELGYVEGQNLRYVYSGPVTTDDAVGVEVDKLLGEDVDLIFAVTTHPAVTAMRATSEIPIIFAPVNNPVEAGLVESLTRPGKNVTGVTNAGGDPRRLQLLMEMDPTIERVYIPYSANNIVPETALATVTGVAEDMGVELVLHGVEGDSPEVNARAIAEMPEDVDAIFILPDDVINTYLNDWIEVAVEKDLPISVPKVTEGVLMSYSFDAFAIGQQSGRLAAHVFKGTAPGDLPVENAEFFLIIDLKIAEEIGLEVPESVLEQANTIVR